MQRIYFDYASTTPTDPAVLKAMEPYFFEKFGNASSSHFYGQEARKALEDSRSAVAGFIGASPDEIVFNSGATEANNHALMGAAHALKDKGNHIIVSSVEHHSVLESAHYLERQGFQVTYLPVDQDGVVDPQAVKNAITDQTICVAVMYASNEIGTIQPISEIGTIIQEKGIVFLVDAVQAVGHIPVHVDELRADLLSMSAHKFYGPNGIGALYMRKGTTVQPFLLGGGQERGNRSSTQNVAGAVGLAKAIDLCQDKMGEETDNQILLRDMLRNRILESIDGVKFNGHPTHRLPNNSHFSFDKVQGEALLMSLDMEGVAASMGSACTSGALEPSHVLRAIGLPDELAYGSLRITLGRWTTEEHIHLLLEKLPGIVERLRTC